MRALFRWRARMARHRAATASRAEWLGAAAAVLLLTGFVALVLATLFADPQALREQLAALGVRGLNRIALALAQLILLVVLAVAVSEEVAALYRAPETAFLLDLPVSPAAFAAHRVALMTLRLLFAGTLLVPLLAVYLFHAHAAGGRALAAAAPLLAVAVLAGAAHLAALVIGATSVVARLLGTFHARTLAAGGLVALAAFACGGLQELAAGAPARAGGGSPPGVLAPIAWLLASLEVVDGAPAGVAALHLAGGLVAAALAVVAAVVAMRVLVLDDLAALRETAQRVQSGSTSRRCPWPLARLPLPLRPLVHEELLFLSRKLVLHAVLLGGPLLAIPLYLPGGALELLAARPAFAIAAHVAVVFIALCDLTVLDLAHKPGFEPLMRALPVPLGVVLDAKRIARSVLFAAAGLACLAGWTVRLPLDGRVVAALAPTIVAAAFAFVALHSGIAYRAAALVPARAGLPALASVAALAASVLASAAVLVPLRLERHALAALGAWAALPLALAAFRAGAAALDRSLAT